MVLWSGRVSNLRGADSGVILSLSSTHNMYGSNDQERTMVDCMLAGVEDWRNAYLKVIYGVSLEGEGGINHSFAPRLRSMSASAHADHPFT